MTSTTAQVLLAGMFLAGAILFVMLGEENLAIGLVGALCGQGAGAGVRVRDQRKRRVQVMGGLNLGQFGKAGYAAIIAFLGSLSTVMIGDVGFGDITDGQWLAAALTALVTAGGVYGIPYRASGSE